jgi:hypothetical protein
MNQPIASESALSDESRWEFGPVIQFKVGIAVRRSQLSASPALPSGFSALGLWEALDRAASRKARLVKNNLLSSRFQQQASAP